MDILPSLSIIIPTLNCNNTLKKCLDSIESQDYPNDKLELVIADGGSTDGTLELITHFQLSSHLQSVKLIENPLKTGEAGKAEAVKVAQNNVLAFIDSDNILPDKNWLKSIVEPFQDEEIIASEPLFYTYRKEDGYITRYCALMGMNDPICLFIGNYDRFSYLTGKWTGMFIRQEDRGNYLKVSLDQKSLPTIGANGFFVRKEKILFTHTDTFRKKGKTKKNLTRDPEKIKYLFDIDIAYELATSNSKIAKVKIGIVHLFTDNIIGFANKQRRRIRDYFYFYKSGLRKYPWGNFKIIGYYYFILSCVVIIPLLMQTLKGIYRKFDWAWFFHPIACLFTFWIYSTETILSFFNRGILDRGGWNR